MRRKSFRCGRLWDDSVSQSPIRALRKCGVDLMMASIINSSAMKHIALVSIYQLDAIGIRSIYSHLKRAGISTNLVLFKTWDWKHRLSFTDRELDLLVQELKRYKPGLVTMGVRSLFLGQAMQITRRLKDEMADVPVFWGGCHPTLFPEVCIEHCDGLVIGEAERPIEELARQLGTPESFAIRNTWVRRDGEIVKNPLRELNDLDDLPFLDLEHENKCYINHDRVTPGDPLVRIIQNGTYNFMCSRGCPYNCTYCGRRELSLKQCDSAAQFLRFRSAKLTVEELRQIKERFNIRRFSSNDDVFILDRKWFEEFVELYARNVAVPFHCQVHPSQVKEWALEGFRKMGLQTISMGVQAGNENTRMNIYNRPTTDAVMVEKAWLVKRYGIIANYDFIFDNPLERDVSPDEDTLKLLLKFPRPFGLNMYKLQHVPGTDLTRQLLEQGLITERDIHGSLDGNSAQFYLGAHPTETRDQDALYWRNLIFMLSTNMVVKTSKRTWAFAPVPKWLVSYLARHRFLWLNKLTWLIRKHRAFYASLGQKLSTL
jgi:anaerobic magnesium-protoporphyrin IX monomethyl ester cyclase